MKARFLLKAVVIIAAFAALYGIADVVLPFLAESAKEAHPGPATLAKPGMAPIEPANAAQPGDGDQSAPANQKSDDSHSAIVKKSVQRLEEGNAAQSLVEMQAAIDLAKQQGASPTEVDALRNMQMRIHWCQDGPEGMLAWMSAPEAALAVPDPQSPAVIDRDRMEIEALLALGKLQEAWDKSKVLLSRFEKPGPGQGKEPLALEQAIRIAATAGADDQIPALEKKLRTAMEASISLKTLVDPQLPLATLGTLAKARGNCLTAIKLYDQALEGFDTNLWLREKRVAPWRLQILALVAMDRVDCLRQAGEIERAKGRASVLAADLATALGEQDPLALQAADLRDQMLFATTSP
ncbi:MAG: hypothetical protein K8R92_01490 [Planctomycetes bacterium]|nr:hypothetical protein [Planctomycetota bacterium]